ncbi:MAG: hypothetical protein J1F33_07425 [Clostridiales bacterium]|nr:hypothetical protein [Clostridiales bacterium]
MLERSDRKAVCTLTKRDTVKSDLSEKYIAKTAVGYFPEKSNRRRES